MHRQTLTRKAWSTNAKSAYWLGRYDVQFLHPKVHVLHVLYDHVHENRLKSYFRHSPFHPKVHVLHVLYDHVYENRLKSYFRHSPFPSLSPAS